MLLYIDLPLIAMSTLSIAMFYVIAHREAVGSLRRRWRWVPFLMAVGIGLSINNGRAVLEALAGKPSEFRRTPKYNLGRGQRLASRRYRGDANADTWVELGFAAWFTLAAIAAAFVGFWGAIPFLLLFQLGYAYTTGLTLAQSRAG